MKNKKIFKILDNVYESINSVKDIKLKLVKGEFSNEYHFGGTKYLPPCVFKNHHYFSLYKPAPNQSSALYVQVGNYPFMMSLSDDRISTLKELKQWILNFDNEYLDNLRRLNNKKAIEDKEIDDIRSLRHKDNELFITPIHKTPSSRLNKSLKLKLYTISSPNSIGDAMSGNMKVVDAYVVKVIKLSNKDYDKFVTDTHHSNIKFDKNLGGVYDKSKTYEVHQIISKNRREVYVNNEGFSYARYLLLPLD